MSKSAIAKELKKIGWSEELIEAFFPDNVEIAFDIAGDTPFPISFEATEATECIFEVKGNISATILTS